MKRILGLDLGVASIGWAVIDIPTDGEPDAMQICGLGSRIIPLTNDEESGFRKGNGETICKGRTLKRGYRRGLDRYQQRRKMLGQILAGANMAFDESLRTLPPIDLWGLRAKAAAGDRLSLPEIGRVIYHINQRRGYKHSKSDVAVDDKKQSDYLSSIKSRDDEARENNQTPGQYFYQHLVESVYQTQKGGTACTYRVKNQVFPRKSYEEELKQILEVQGKYYPGVLTEDVQEEIFNYVFYQRPLKSCKHLVSLCEFESREIIDEKTGHVILKGPKVAPVSSPLFQLCRIWEVVNNIELHNPKNRSRRKKDKGPVLPLFADDRKFESTYYLNLKEKRQVVNHLLHNEKLSERDLLKILGLKKDDGFAVDKNIAKGIKGNDTYVQLRKALGDYPNADELLRFDVQVETENVVDPETGEVKEMQLISNSYLREPLYQLWHTVYSIKDKDELAYALRNKFGITDDDVINRMFNIDFSGKGYGNKSSKFICKILPCLMGGCHYNEACDCVGVNHSASITKEENENRELASSLQLLKRVELRQPVVEKILNQMVHQVNAILEAYGPIDEIHVEMARTLKQSKEKRAIDSSRINARESENKKISDIIQTEYNLRPSRNRIQKYRMWLESEHCCMYCGKPIGVNEFLAGTEVEKEHVIPRSVFFDDSFSNKVCACRECNRQKGQMTGYDFMASKGQEALDTYIDRVECLYDVYKKTKGASGISKTKHDRLLTPFDEIPTEFLNRDLVQTQYIARKAIGMLKTVCRNVYPTTGSVTDFFRHAWGYDEILHNLNLPAYKEGGQTEIIEFTHKGQTHQEERITGWTKRWDHRHHAIDALVIALVTQSHIQRLNNLNTLKDNETSGEYERQARNLDRWAESQPHFSYADTAAAVSGIAVSFKSGKKATTPGKRIVYKKGKRVVAQEGLVIPRGALTEESVYGVVKVLNPKRKLKEIFSNPALIVEKMIRESVVERLVIYNHDIKRAVASCKKDPLMLDKEGNPVSEFDCWELKVVKRYGIESVQYKNIAKVVDAHIRNLISGRYETLRSTLGNPADGKLIKAYQESLTTDPLYSDEAKHHKIITVRMFTDINQDNMMVVHRNADGKGIGFSKLGSNHHIALYRTPDGYIEECVVPFAHAVMRKNLGIPVIIQNPDTVWAQIENLKEDVDESLLMNIPMPQWKFLFSMQQNEMFLIGLSEDEITDMKSNDKTQMLNHLYRIQALSSKYYDFKKHTCTLSDKGKDMLANHQYVRITSFGIIRDHKIWKVRVDRLGNLVILHTYD